MIIFAKHTTERLRYTLSYVFTERLGVEWVLTNNLDEFNASKHAKINYSGLELNGFQVLPDVLLFEDSIKDSKPKVHWIDGKALLYSNNSKLEFDIFAATFWMISRYEEYQTYQHDKHDRFPGSESLAFANNFLCDPVVDQWIIRLKKALNQAYPDLLFKAEMYEVKATIDIDNPWYYRHKGLYRTFGGIVRDLWAKNWKAISDRLKIIFYLKADPNFVFDYMDDLFSKHHLKPMYFLHVGDYGPYDKSTAFYKRAFRLLLSRITYNNKWGVHPSYAASTQSELLEKEQLRLEKISGQKVINSRHHYLKINLPNSYQMLLQQGIENDFSMGFADRVGFRAGTSRPFCFFDLNKNESTKLMIHPFVVMDGTIKEYEKIEATEALKYLAKIITNVKDVNGLFVSLWHNESLSNCNEWQGWRFVYEEMLKLSTE